MLVLGSCPFTAYAVTDTGAYLLTIGTGNAWQWTWFNFKVPCGLFKVLIVFKCNPLWSYIDVQENDHSCTDCRNPIMTYFDPKTCTCKCAN